MTAANAAATAAHAAVGVHTGQQEGDEDAENVLLLHGSSLVPSMGNASGKQQSRSQAAGSVDTLECEGGSAAVVDGEAVIARTSRHILPLFFLLALLCSIDRGVRLSEPHTFCLRIKLRSDSRKSCFLLYQAFQPETDGMWLLEYRQACYH